MNSKEQHRQAMELFDHARALIGDDRRRYLKEACRDDDSRRYVESLLRHDELPIGLISAIERGVGAQLVNLDVPDSFVDTPAVGDAIRQYHLLEKIGQGGFGVVYRAEQREPFRREVALKLIKPGMDSRFVISRFEAERQALAHMNHPGIAKVLDGGETDDGRPYFVMEFVAGEPIVSFCDAQRCSIEERLRLFVVLCEAVQHAHTKGVIHRDLKPGNILVARDAEGRPQPKVIDFGVAKALHEPLTEKALVTHDGQLIGTPEFMSPEQAEMGGTDIDTRSDIYTLGVILYELLIGFRPFDRDLLRRAGLAEFARFIREVEPARPSARLMAGPAREQTADDVMASTHARRTDPRTLAATMRRDLDWVVMKCLEKDRARRYETANALASDLRRYLDHEPVLAGPPTAAYRLRKFARRHRIAVASGTLLTVVLASATIVSTRFGMREAAAHLRETRALVRESEARQRADQRAEETRRVADFQNRMLRGIDVNAMGDGIKERFRDQVRAALEREEIGKFPNRRKRTPAEVNAKLRAFDQRAAAAQTVDVARQVMDDFVLKPAAATVKGQFADQPLVRAQIQDALGSAYRALGLYAASERHLRAALESQRQVLDAGDGQTASILDSLSEALRLQGKYSDAEPLAREALDMRRALPGEHIAVAQSLNNLAALLRDKGDFAGAKMRYEEGLALIRRLAGDEHESVPIMQSNLAAVLISEGDNAAAEAILREALALREKAGIRDHPDIATGLNNLGTLLMDRGDYAAAESLYVEALAMRRKMLGSQHPETVQSVGNLAALKWKMGEYREAERLHEETLAARRLLLGNQHPDVAQSLNDLGTLFWSKGDHVAAEVHYREALAIRRGLFGDNHPLIATSLANLALSLKGQGKLDEAESMLRDALALRRTLLGDNHADTAGTLSNLASVLQDKRDYAGAEPLFFQALSIRRKLLGNEHPAVATSANNLGWLHWKRGDFVSAEPLFREALAIRRKVLGGKHPDLAVSINNLATLLMDTGRYGDAVTLHREALDMKRQLLGDEHPSVANSLHNLGTALRSNGDFAAAEPVDRETLAVRSRTLPPDHPDLSRSRVALGVTLTKLGRYAEALEMLLLAEQSLAASKSAPQTMHQCRRSLVELYDAWHIAEPGKGHDAKAATRREQLAFDATTQPARSESSN